MPPAIPTARARTSPKCMSAAPNDATYFIMRDAALRAAQNMKAAERVARDILNEVELVDMVEMEEVEY
jgi:hypothetical protein